jgi:hypothetical protein
MPYQVRVGSLVIIAKDTADAVIVFDCLVDQHGAEQISVSDMTGAPADVEELRRAARAPKAS